MGNPSAEKLLLSCFVRHPTTFFNLSSYLSEEDFISMGHKYIFQCIKSLYVDDGLEKVSKLKIISKAKSLGFENFMTVTKDGAAIDAILTENVPESECTTHFQVVKRETIRQTYAEVADDLKGYVGNTQDSATQIVDNVEQKLFNVSTLLNSNDSKMTNIGASAEEIIGTFTANPGLHGWDLGFPVWQNRIGQVRNGSITFVVASAKQGKSQFALRSALTVAMKYSAPVLLIDTELKKKDQTVRMVGMLAGVPYEIIETGFWNLDEDGLRAQNIPENRWADFAEYKRRMNDPVFWQKVKSLKLDYLEASGLGVEQVIPKMRRWIMTNAKPSKTAIFPECLIVYDYVKLATLDELRGGKLQEYQLHGLNMATLHDFVNQANVPMLAFGQTNRSLEYSTDCVAGAKRIIDNVSSMTLMKRKTAEEKSLDPTGSHFLMPLETRYGAGMHSGHINLAFSTDLGEFHELGVSSIDFREEKRRRLEEDRYERKSRRKKNDDDDDDN